MLRICFQARLDQARLHAVAPDIVSRRGHDFGFQPKPGGKFLPQRGEMPGFIHQHVVTRTQRVDQRSLPRTGTGGGVNDDGLAGLKDIFHVRQHLEPEHRELRSTVVNGGVTHGPQHAVRHWRGARYLQKMAARRVKV